VLLVEDESSIQDILGSVLKNAGYRVKAALDGAEAIEAILASSGHLDIVVLDLNMPRLGGMEVIKVLRERWPTVPVLIITGNMNSSIQAELDELGQHNIMEKPFDLSEFGRVLRKLLDERVAP
jgi:DNA-binding response OmpR family regulator